MLHHRQLCCFTWYQVIKDNKLFFAFIDLSVVLNSLNRNMLWKKLSILNMEPRLLLHEKCINILLYADVVVIEYSQVSLKKLLQKLNTCNLNSLNINKTESKVFLFAKVFSKKVWNIIGSWMWIKTCIKTLHKLLNYS